MLFNKHNLAIAKFASKTKFGKAIECVYFDKDKTVATDSFRLVEMSTPVANIEDFPIIPNYTVVKEDKNFIVNAMDVLSFKTPKPLKNLAITGNAALAEVGENIALISTDLKTTQAVIGKKITDSFPDYEKFFSKEEPTFEITVNGNYLWEILKTLSGLNKFGQVTLKFYAPNKSFEIHAEGNGQKARALQMPMNR